MPVGDVEDQPGQADDLALRAVEPVVADRPDALLVGGRGEAAVLLVHHWDAGTQHLVGDLLQPRVQAGQHLAYPLADVLGDRQAVDLLQRAVQPDVAALLVVDHDADRELLEQRVQDRAVAGDADQVLGGVGVAEDQDVPVAVPQAHEMHVDRNARAARGDGVQLTARVVAGPDRLDHPVGGAVVGGPEHRVERLAEHLRTLPSQQLLGVEPVLADDALAVEHERRRADPLDHSGHPPQVPLRVALGSLAEHRGGHRPPPAAPAGVVLPLPVGLLLLRRVGHRAGFDSVSSSEICVVIGESVSSSENLCDREPRVADPGLP